MADKPVKLTDRGKHTLIVVVTVTGCILGILFSFVLSVSLVFDVPFFLWYP